MNTDNATPDFDATIYVVKNYKAGTNEDLTIDVAAFETLGEAEKFIDGRKHLIATDLPLYSPLIAKAKVNAELVTELTSSLVSANAIITRLMSKLERAQGVTIAAKSIFYTEWEAIQKAIQKAQEAAQ